MSHKIVVVGAEDAPLRQHFCEVHGRVVEFVDDIDAALDMHAFTPLDAIVIDRPKKVALTQAITALAGKAGETAILLTVDSIPPAEEAGLLRAGADDIVVRPYSFDVLDARVDRAIRRGRKRRTDVRKVGDFEMSMVDLRLTWRGEFVKLTFMEAKIIGLLLDKPGRVATHDLLLDLLYFSNGGATPHVKVLDVFICKIRRKLRELTGSDAWIETVRPRGWAWRVELEAA